ncbi:unnamed protein product [Lupinus luteus]|uniref:Peptidase A1 domain-containing protein n=1 Tax=Lupinus luteus TaxID=3873 RepID=A0AAV1X8M2_LUPLU
MVHRSINRINSIRDPPQPIITNSGGEYLMKYSIGYPRVEITGLVDTGSDLIWLQCEPCISCYHQTSPIFDSLNSKSYEDIPCPSTQCSQALGQTKCNSSLCEYGIAYTNNGFSKGDLAFEEISLRTSSSSLVRFEQVIIGCGHNNQGPLSPGFSGVIGMGFGYTSLISQISEAIDYKFAYCLTQTQTTSKLHFGANAIVSGLGVVTTPLAFGESRSFYYLSLEGVTIGSRRVEIIMNKEENSTIDKGNLNGNLKGNIFIDSGTALTFIPRHVILHESNIFFPMSPRTLCLAFAPTTESAGILGNIAQANFVVGFDRRKRTVSFKRADCTKY